MAGVRTRRGRISPARRAAFEILSRVDREQAYASNLLSSSTYETLSKKDHTLLQELTLGVLRWRARLDHLSAYYAKRPAEKLDESVRIALRMGLYQIRFLTRVPPHAAVNESVEITKEYGPQGAVPLVNAVLRAAVRDRDQSQTELVNEISDPLQRLVVQTSHPAWLLERWLPRLGMDDTFSLAMANNGPPRGWFRFNNNRAPEDETRAWLAANDLKIHESDLVPGAAALDGHRISRLSELAQEGRIIFQDAASQFVAYLASGFGKDRDRLAIPSHRVADICAPPGGKSFILESLLPAGTLFVAGDLHHQRLRLMRSLAHELKLELPRLVQFDATAGVPFKPGEFDLVLVDAPCTGLGTLQRNPEIKWRLLPEKILELATIQRVLIEQAASLVRQGGLLTYSVCSTEPEEGEDIVASFKERHPEYRDVTRERLVELGLDPEQFLTASYGARTLTHLHQTESFFVAVLWRRA